MENNPVSLPAILKTDIFKIIERNGNKIKAKCQLCVGELGEISGSTKTTTNFLTHIRRKHPQHIDALNGIINRKRSSISFDDEDGQSPNKKLKDTMASDNFVRNGISIEKCNWSVLEEVRPLTRVEKPSFKNLMGTVSSVTVKPMEPSLSNNNVIRDAERPGGVDDRRKTLITSDEATSQTLRCKNPLELQEAGACIKQVKDNSNAALEKKETQEEDECDLYGKILAKKLKSLSENERLEFMYEIDGMFLRRQSNHSRKHIHSPSTVICFPSPSPSPNSVYSYNQQNRPESSYSCYSESMPSSFHRLGQNTRVSYSDPTIIYKPSKRIL